MTHKRKSGFSVLELVIVLAIVLIVTAIAVPSMRRVMEDYRLQTNGRDVANMLHEVRLAAVQNNQPYYVQIGSPTQASSQSATQLAGGPAPASTPTITTASSVSFQAAGPANTGALDAVVGGGIGGAPLVGGVIGFSARGIPCQQPAGNPFNCVPVTVGFEWFLLSNVSNQWEAVTVTPAGRIRSWRQSGSGNWQ